MSFCASALFPVLDAIFEAPDYCLVNSLLLNVALFVC
jgi:hypothetical protein